jgi:hypothetical protein
MGSPITSWDGAEAYFIGAGGVGLVLFLVLAVTFVVVALVYGARHESHAYDKCELE